MEFPFSKANPGLYLRAGTYLWGTALAATVSACATSAVVEDGGYPDSLESDVDIAAIPSEFPVDPSAPRFRAKSPLVSGGDARLVWRAIGGYPYRGTASREGKSWENRWVWTDNAIVDCWARGGVLQVYYDHECELQVANATLVARDGEWLTLQAVLGRDESMQMYRDFQHQAASSRGFVWSKVASAVCRGGAEPRCVVILKVKQEQAVALDTP